MITKIKRYGFEIEGEYSNDFRGAIAEHGEMKGDGSVRHCNSDLHIGKFNSSMRTGEYNSPILNFTNAGLAKGKKIVSLFQEAYNKGEFHWNKSCGFHVHVSFDPVKPADLYSSQFAAYFEKALNTKFPGVVSRRKNNNYCRMQFSDEEIADPTERYRFINFTMGHHPTLEFRIFPAAMPTRMWSFVEFTLATIARFIKEETLVIKQEIDIFTIVSKREITSKIPSAKESMVEHNELLEFKHLDVKLK